MERKENTQYVLSLSYGKDSLATIEACRQLGYPIDRIVHAEVWATDDIPADLPPMVEFKKKADKIIKERYGIEVEHVCAMRDGEKLTYEKLFYTVPKRKSGGGGRSKDSRDRAGSTGASNSKRSIFGFSTKWIPACTGHLKRGILDKYLRIPLLGRSEVRMVQAPQIFGEAP